MPLTRKDTLSKIFERHTRQTPASCLLRYLDSTFADEIMLHVVLLPKSKFRGTICDTIEGVMAELNERKRQLCFIYMHVVPESDVFALCFNFGDESTAVGNM